jgi:methyl-accepting chemotaxis protein
MATKFGTGIAKGENSFEVGKLAAQQALSKIGERVDLSIVFSSGKYNHAEVVKGIREITENAPLIGCSTYGEFTEEKVEKGSVAIGLISTDSIKFFPAMGEELSQDPLGCVQDIDKNIHLSEEDVKNFPNKAGIVLGDGLVGKGEELVMSTSMVFNLTLFGGTASNYWGALETYVFMNDEVKSDAAVICEVLSKSPIAFGVKHGHLPISPPLKVTRAAESVVYEMDNKPAWEVWKEYCRDYAREDLKLDVDKLKTSEEIVAAFEGGPYEVGIQVGSGYMIRAPLFVNEDGSISFTTGINEGSMIRVMRGTKESLIMSAKKAAQIALSKMEKKNIAGAIVFDCAVRSAILKDDFFKAVNEVKNVVGAPLIGFESLGEIGMEVGDVSGFHNTTTVVVLIPK